MDNNSFKCPVCGRHPIADYHHEDVECPQCHSDLKIFRELNDIKEQAETTVAPSQKKWKAITLLSGLIALIAIGANFIPRDSQVKIVDDSQEIVSLRNQKDSLVALVDLMNDSIKSIKETNIVNKLENESQPGSYQVQRGDSFWKISQKVYGSANRYAEIAKLNGMNIDDVIHVGDLLKVNPK